MLHDVVCDARDAEGPPPGGRADGEEAIPFCLLRASPEEAQKKVGAVFPLGRPKTGREQSAYAASGRDPLTTRATLLCRVTGLRNAISKNDVAGGSGGCVAALSLSSQ